MSTKHLEDNFGLSPLQRGILFNTLYAPESGVDVVQVVCKLHEHIQTDKFEQAWQSVFQRYSVLRTAFRWEGLPEFQQKVHPSVALPLKHQDWRTVLPESRKSHLENFLREDRRSGFDLSQPPLARLTLNWLSEDLYYLIFTFHHIILDGRSLLILFKDAFSIYDSLCQGQELDLPIEETPYRDYVFWLQNRDAKTDEAFWQQWFKDFTTTTPIVNNTSLLQEANSSNGHKEQDVRLSRSVTTALNELARENQITPNTILQGAWSLLLSRYNQQDDVVFGVTRSCRRETIEGSKSVVGLMINTLPMRVQLSPNTNLLNWLKEIRFQSKALHEHIHADLTRVQAYSEIPKKTPLFDHIVIFEHSSLHSALQAQGGKWSSREFELRRKPNYPLVVYGFNEPELLIKIIYDQEQFDDAPIKRMLGYLQTLLEKIVVSPNCRLAELSLLTVEERQQLLNEWNAVQVDYSHDQCIHKLFEEQAEHTPDATAVTFEDQCLTYYELNANANKLARYLQKLGVNPNEMVGICMEPSIDMIIGLLGILKSGGAYVPLNPAYPKERLAFIMEDTQISILLTETRLVNKLPSYSGQIICLDAELSNVASQDSSNLANTVPENLAYVIYTSGSTGQPKGVMVTHNNVTSLLAATQPWFQFDEHDIWTLFHSFAFDFSVWEIWGALLHGSQLVIVPFWVSRSPEAFYELLNQKRVTILNQTPSAFYQLVRVDSTVESRQKLNLRWIIFGGEKLEFRNLKPWLMRYGDSSPQLVNMYGITETTVHVTFRPITLSDLENPAASLIGRPIPGWQVYLLDHYQQPVPVGVPGEIYVGGLGVSNGYLNRPELTAERFIPNPFDSLNGTKLYRSGDLARYLPNGDIEYLGRIDQQVKIRGFRIELGEIETILKEHPAVQDCVVLMHEEKTRDKHLVAYVVAQMASVSSNDLYEFLGTKLPDYMLPAFVFLDALPLTQNGKLDQRALPVPNWNLNENTSFVLPRNPTEKDLAKIWADVLRLKQIGVQDNFFRLGGHSLLATQIMARVRQTFKVELPLRVLFDAPTIERMAQVILERQKASEHLHMEIRPTERISSAMIDSMSDKEVDDFLSEFFDETT